MIWKNKLAKPGKVKIIWRGGNFRIIYYYDIWVDKGNMLMVLLQLLLLGG